MPEYYDNYYEYNNANPNADYEYDPNADYDEYDDAYAYLEDSDNDEANYGNAVDDYPPYKTEIWSQLRVQQDNDYYIVHVSNRGKIKPNAPTFQECIASSGTQLRGTPYMVTHVGNKDYYIHELVWRAFVGPVPTNYIVRHKSHYVEKRKHLTYCNRVECLELYLNNIASVD